MVWRGIATNISNKTPFLVFPNRKDYTNYIKTNKNFIVRNDRVYICVEFSEIGEEIRAEFKEEVLLLSSFNGKPSEYMSVIALCTRNLESLLSSEEINIYNQKVSFSIPYTRLAQNTFKVFNTFSPEFSSQGSAFFEHPLLKDYYAPIIFNMAKSYSILEDLTLSFEKPILYIGKRKDLEDSKFTFIDEDNIELIPTIVTTKSFYLDTEIILYYFEKTPFNMSFIA